MFQDDLVRAYRGFLDRRRAVRPAEEYRDPTDAEWREFQQLLRVDPAQKPRLEEIHANLIETSIAAAAQKLADAQSRR